MQLRKKILFIPHTTISPLPYQDSGLCHLNFLKRRNILVEDYIQEPTSKRKFSKRMKYLILLYTKKKKKKILNGV